MTTFPALELAVIRVTRVDSAEAGDKLRWTIQGERIGYPVKTIQVVTLSEWKAALCERAEKLGKPVSVGWRDYGNGERRLVTAGWAE